MEENPDPTAALMGPKEHVLWRGQPNANVLLSPQDPLLIPFSFMWAGFVFFGVGGSLKDFFKAGSHVQDQLHQAPPVFLLVWMLPFLCAGLYMTAGRFLHLRWLKRHTWYALTDKRVIIVTQGLTGRSVREQGITTIRTIERNMRKSGVGTLHFDPAGGLEALYRPWPTQRLGTMAFVDIDAADTVYEQLVKARGNGAQ